MARPLVVGNGRILVAFDNLLNMRDFYYPFVGQWNHIQGRRNRLGVWTDSGFAWTESPGWEHRLRYREGALVTEVHATHAGLKVALTINDAVDYHENVYLKRVTVRNLDDREREVRLFFTQNFSIDETPVGDTALFDPVLHVVYHYKKNRYLLANAMAGQTRFHQYATGLKRVGAIEGTFRDAEDGTLSGNPIAQGSVDSVIGLHLRLGPGRAETAYYWICCGRNYQEIRRLNAYVLRHDPCTLIEQTEAFWQSWLARADADCRGLRPRLVELYKTSLLLVRAHLDDHGAIIAACDSDIMGGTNKDHYCYVWPRDGAMIALALIRAGYAKLTRSFFGFCANVLTEGGYLLHKYNPDGTLGSSWHPLIRDGVVQLPIQEDETALVLIALYAYYAAERDLEFISDLHRSFIVPAADFMAGYIDEELNLPQESYDLWEERHGIFTFTASAVYGGLSAAAAFARLFGDGMRAAGYEARAEQVKQGILERLWSPELNRFVRGLVFDPREGRYGPDQTLESSTAGVYLFGVLPPDDPRVAATMRAIEDGLLVQTAVSGIARYTGDRYFQRSQDVYNVPGNPWFICTLWLAQWYIAVAKAPDDLFRAQGLIEWAAGFALESGVLSEQLDPFSGGPLSVAPLVWSHSTYILALQELMSRQAAFRRRGTGISEAAATVPAGRPTNPGTREG
ncbi:MAG: glycoside hydrolase family 15 protein [Bacillota bacterium]|nr:glycoside hydrolase family 15 protein [Bacillota bacterium]